MSRVTVRLGGSDLSLSDSARRPGLTDDFKFPLGESGPPALRKQRVDVEREHGKPWISNIWNLDPVHKAPLFCQACVQHPANTRTWLTLPFPPFLPPSLMCLSYACHTDTFFISLVFLSNPYRILVITKLKKKIYLEYTSQYHTSKRYAKPQKDVLGIYRVLSFLVWNSMFLSYSVHIPVITFSCSAESGPQMKFSR